jgi:hypothetical protein
MKIFEKLTRNEMKNVLGGKAAPVDGGVTCNVIGVGSAQVVECPYSDLDKCQDEADSNCEKDDACVDTACKYA